MRFPKKIKDLIDQMRQVDFINVNDKESSMLRSDERQQYLKIYAEKVLPNYKSKLDAEFGGDVDAVLKDLENYLVKKIDRLCGWEKESEKETNANESTLSPGELARSDAQYRSEIGGELGKYHTALRALKDTTTVNWPSLLHEGSNEMEFGLLLREVLAYYWLAASDEKMEFAEIFAKEVNDAKMELVDDVASDKKRTEFLEASKEVFIDVLCEIRRAHNEGHKKNSKLDDPSCGPGTIGRIFSCGSVYNKLTAPPVSAYDAIPASIQGFIVAKLESEKNFHRAVYNYLNSKLMGDNPSESDQKLFAQFVSTLNINELQSYLLQQSHLKLTQTLVKRILSPLNELFQIELTSLKLNSDSLPNTEFVYRLLQVGIKSLHQEEIAKVLSKNVVDYRLSLLSISHEVNVLNRLVDNEIIRSLLAPSYAVSPKFTFKMESFLELAQVFFTNTGALRQNLLSSVNTEDMKIHEKLYEDSILPKKDFTPTALEITNFLAETTKNRLIKLEETLHLIFTKINAVFAKDNREEKIATVLSLLPRAPGKSVVTYNRGEPEDWANNLIRLINEKEANGSLVNDQAEINRNIELIQTSVNVTERLKISGLIQGFKSKSSDGPSNTSKRIASQLAKIHINDHLEECKHLFGDDFESVMTMSKIKICRDYNFSEQDQSYQDWKKILLTLCLENTSDEATKLKKIKNFIVLAAFNNLEVSKLGFDNFKTMQWLCERYITNKNDKELLFPVTESDTLAERLRKMAGHFSCLFTTLKIFSGLVEAGCICLLSSEETVKLVKQAMTEGIIKPYLIRVSNSEPNNLIMACSIDGKTVSQYKITTQQIGNQHRTYTIEGKVLSFITDRDELIRQTVHHPMLKTLIIGEQPLGTALSDPYIAQATRGYLVFMNQVSIAQTTKKIEDGMYTIFEKSEEKANTPCKIRKVESSSDKHFFVKFFEDEAKGVMPNFDSTKIIQQLNLELLKLTEPEQKLPFLINLFEAIDDAFKIVLANVGQSQRSSGFLAPIKKLWSLQCIKFLKELYLQNLNNLTTRFKFDGQQYKELSEVTLQEKTKGLVDYEDTDANIKSIRAQVIELTTKIKPEETFSTKLCQ